MECIILFVGSRWDFARTDVPEVIPPASAQCVNEHDKLASIAPPRQWMG
jgi:hypothetical protein